VSRSWKIPGSKLAVLPRTTCYFSASGATVEMYDQGDDYVRIQNFTDGHPRTGLYYRLDHASLEMTGDDHACHGPERESQG
jgi:hypothetical protein